MGKKQKGTRRQILQLESKKPQQMLTKPLKNLIHYSDSDDDSKKSNESDSSAPASGKKGCPLDTQVADFFKEIDALTVNEDCIEPKENILLGKSELKDKDKCTDILNDIVKPETNAVKGTNETESVAYYSWQEIKDESTGYSYYWNVESNEVTWDCPEEYVTYVNINSSHTNINLSKNIENNELILKKSQKQKPPCSKQEGSIIPISYFGESSSEEEMSYNEKKAKRSRSQRKKLETVGNKSKIKMESETFNEIIGPQLPPNFEFPIVEDSNKSFKNFISCNETAQCIEKNVCLNQNINNCIDSKTCSKSPLNVIYQSQILDPLDTIKTFSNQTAEETINKEKITANVNKGTGKESPASTVKPVIGLVVEYDSFTDEDEEVSTSNSCIKHISPNSISLTTRNQNQENIIHIEKDSLKEVESTKNIFAGVKRKSFDESNTESNKIFSDKRSKKSKISSSLDIDNLFASHVSNQKHGFGFKMQEEFEDCDADIPDNYENTTVNRKNGFKSVNFVKSNQIFDLNDICDSTFCKTAQPATTKKIKHVQSQEQFEKENKDYGKELDFELKSIKCSANETSHILDEDLPKPNISENAASLSYEEDIDEIDKALCEALEAKKTIEKDDLVFPSDFPSQELKESNDCFIESSSEEDNSSSNSNEGYPIQEKTNILNLSSDLADKLTFLISNHSNLASLSTLLVQLQTRLIDWQASALESLYFLARLQEVNNYVYQYEASIVSGDWICEWDRKNKRYFYTNRKTNHSQWVYPEELKKYKTPWSSFHTSQQDNMSSANLVSSHKTELSTTSLSRTEKPLTNKISESFKDKDNYNAILYILPSPPPPPPGVDSPPPPPPCSPPPYSPPPPPPDTTDKTSDQPEDMDLENSNDSCSHPIISDTALYEDNQIHYSPMLSCSADHLLNAHVDNSVTSISSSFKVTNEDSSLIPRSQHTFPVVSNSCSVNNKNVLWSGPQPSCGPDVFSLENQTSVITSVSSQPLDSAVDSCLSSSTGVHLTSSNVMDKANVNTINPPLKKDKKKTKLLSVLALKKKNIPSLVEKWQKIREEQEKEQS